MVPVGRQKYIRVLISIFFFSISLFSPNWLNLPIDVHQLGYIINCGSFGELLFVAFQKNLGNRFVVLVQIKVFLPHFLKRNSSFFLYRKIEKKTLIINLTKKQTTELTGGSVQINF